MSLVLKNRALVVLFVSLHLMNRGVFFSLVYRDLKHFLCFLLFEREVLERASAELQRRRSSKDNLGIRVRCICHI